MALLLYLVFMSAVLGVVCQMWLFDRLVRWEYEHSREHWERDGRPDGYFWRPPDCVPWRSGIARKRVGVVWLFYTPDWAAETPECRRCLALMRTAFVATALVFLLFMVFLAH